MPTNDDNNAVNPFAKFVTAAAPAAADQEPAAVNPFAKYVDPSYKAPPALSWGGMIRDTALDLVGGGLDIGKQAYGLANLAVGGELDPASRAVTGAFARGLTQAGDLVTGRDTPLPTDEQAGTIAQGLQRLDEGLAGLQTPYRQQLQQQRQLAMEQADGPWEEAKAAVVQSLGNPSLLAGDVVRSGASMFAPAAGAEAVTARFGPEVFERAAQRALAGGATREAAQAAGNAAVGKLGERAVIGITGVGQVAGGDDVDTVNKVLAADQQKLAANPEYQQLIAAGLSDVAARDELARKAGLVNALVAAPISMAASKLTGAGRQLAEVVTGNYAGKGAVDLLKAAGKEATQEVLESGGERLGANLGEQAYGDPETPTWKGVTGEAVLGGLAGAVMGAGEHVLGGHHGEQHGTVAAQPAARQPAAAPTTPEDALAGLPKDAGPLTRAAAIATVTSASLFPFADAAMAQKQADQRTNATGVAHEVVDHPTVAGRFAAVPVAPKADAAAPAARVGAPADDALADLFGSSVPNKAGLQPGDPVQVTLNGVDLFPHGTRITSISDDGKYAMVEGSNAGVPTDSLRHYTPPGTPPPAPVAITPVDAAAHAAASSPQNDLAPPTKRQINANNATLGHEKVRTGLAVDQQDLDNLTGWLAENMDPATGKPIHSEGRRNELHADLANLQDAVASATEFLQQHEAGAGGQQATPTAPREAARIAQHEEDKAEFAWDMLEQISQSLTDDADIDKLQPLADKYKGTAADQRKAKEAALKQLDAAGQKEFLREQKQRADQDTVEVAKTTDAVRAEIEEALGRKLNGGAAAQPEAAPSAAAEDLPADATVAVGVNDHPSANTRFKATARSASAGQQHDHQANGAPIEAYGYGDSEEAARSNAQASLRNHIDWAKAKAPVIAAAKAAQLEVEADSGQVNVKVPGDGHLWVSVPPPAGKRDYFSIDLRHDGGSYLNYPADRSASVEQLLATARQLSDGTIDPRRGSYQHWIERDRMRIVKEDAGSLTLRFPKSNVDHVVTHPDTIAHIRDLIAKADAGKRRKPAGTTTSGGTAANGTPRSWQSDLHERVLKALEPGQFGGRLTAERLGGILGDPDKQGSTIGTARAQQALDALEQAGQVQRDGRSYALTTTPSDQFTRYQKAIEQGQWSHGMQEQIDADERLKDGEAARLRALAGAATAGTPAVSKTTPEDRAAVKRALAGYPESATGRGQAIRQALLNIQAEYDGKEHSSPRVPADITYKTGRTDKNLLNGGGVGKFHAKATSSAGQAGGTGKTEADAKAAAKLNLLLNLSEKGQGGAVAAPARPQEPSAAPTATAKPGPAPTAPDRSSVRARLKEIAKRLGVPVVESKGGFNANYGMVEIPAEDAQVEGALSPEHVFAHELGHVVLQKRGLSFQGFPKAEMLKWADGGWPALVAASKRYRPAVWEHADERIRRHARKPNEVLADAIGSVLIGEQPLSLLAGFMEKRGITVRDLGLEDGEQASAPQQAEPASGPEGTAESARLENATAPEHVVVGVDDRELGQIVDEFNAAQAEMMEGDHPVTNIFQPPKKGEVVRLADKARVYHKDHGWMSVAEAKAQIAKWKEHAQAQGENDETRRANGQRVVLSLFDLSGEWSRPWEEAGYQVYRFDIQDDPEVGDVNNFSTDFFGDWFGDFEGQDIYAILAACPCTDFAVSGARHFAAKDQDGRTVASVKLVHQTLRVIEYFKPAVWAVENPVGRIEKLGGLPPWRLSFDPNHLGEPYTKKTLIWGRFNGDLPVAPVEPTEGSKMHKLYGGKSMATKNARSETPQGFAYGFFMANNAVDHPAMAIANKYDRLDRDLIAQAVAAGVTETQINDAVEDFYYQDLDDDAANEAIRELIAEHAGEVGGDEDEAGDEMTPELEAAPGQPETDSDRAAALLQSLVDKANRGEAATSDYTQVGLRVALQRDDWAEGETVIKGGEVWNKGNLRATITPAGDNGKPTITVKQRKLTAKEQAAEEERKRNEAVRAKWRAEARAHWKVGMVTSLPTVADVEGSDQKYTMGLPGVIESIDGDHANVRIYAAPEYGYTLENYPLHGKLAVKVPLTELGGMHGGNNWNLEALGRIAKEGKLATGDANVAATVRARTAKVKYPNRNFGEFWQTRPTPLEDARDPKWWAEVAFTNMRRGDTFTAGGKTYTVEGLKKVKESGQTYSSIALKDQDGGEQTFWPHSMEWHRLVPLVAAQLKAENEMPDTAKRPLLDILKRDPAARVDDKGSVYLRDGEPEPGQSEKSATSRDTTRGESEQKDDSAAKPAAALPDPPTLDYRLQVRGQQTYLVPPVGKAFTEELRTALRDWLRGAGYFSTIIGDNRVSVSATSNSPPLDHIEDGVQTQRIAREVEKERAAAADKPGLKRMQDAKAARDAQSQPEDAQGAAPDDDALFDAEWQDAVGHLGDVLGDVFGAKKNITGPQYGAGDLLPALSRVIELLVRKGLRSFKQAVATAARGMRQNDKTAPHVDRISPRQWKAAYNAIAELHEGTDSEADVHALGEDEVKALIANADRIARLRREIAEIEQHIADGTVPSWFRSDRPITDGEILHAIDPSGENLTVEDVQPEIDAMRADPRGLRAALWDRLKKGLVSDREDLIASMEDGSYVHGQALVRKIDTSDGLQAEAAPGELAGPQQRAVEESDQDRSHREWDENYDRVVNAPDLAAVSDKDIERARNFIGMRIARLGPGKAWEGDQAAKNMIDALRREDAHLKAELTRRAASVSRPAAADRLEKLLEVFTADRNTPAGAARSDVRTAVEALRNPRSPIRVVDILERASERLHTSGHQPQSRVVDEVIEQLGNASKPDMVADELVVPEPPAVDERERAKVLAEIYANAGNPVDTDGHFKPGVFGTPDQPLRFISGMSAPGDFTRLFSNGKNVGISVRELSKSSIPKIAQQLAAAPGAYLFVDSGAFSVFMSNLREQRDADDAHQLDHDKVLARYDELQHALSVASDGMAMGRMLMVMPDIVGDQAGSLALVAKYAEQINLYGLQAIVPLQGGELTLTEAYEQMMRNLGMEPTDISPIIGIPSQAEAVSNEELTDLLRKYGDYIWGVHVLGAVSDARLQPRLDAIVASGYDGNVSADANRIRALISNSRPRKQAFDHVIQSDMADGSPVPRVVRDDQRPEPGEPLSELGQRARRAETVGATIEENTANGNPNEYQVNYDGHLVARFELGQNGKAMRVKHFAAAQAVRDIAQEAIDRFVAERNGSGAAATAPAPRKGRIPPPPARTPQAEAKAPAKPKGFGQKRLRQDFGVPHIDGYTETKEFPHGPPGDVPTGGVKAAFIKDARAYLKDVTGMLLDHGFTNAEGRDGKALKPVSVNEAGPAVAGDISLVMYHEGAERGIYVHIGEGMGITHSTKSGVAVMMRVTKKADPYGGGENLWMAPDLTAAELADKIRAAVFAASPNRDTLNATEKQKDDHGSDDTGADGAQALAAVAAGKNGGTEGGGPVQRGGASRGQAGAGRDRVADGDRVSGARGAGSGVAATDPAAAGGTGPGRLGGKGSRRQGKGVSGNDARTGGTGQPGVTPAGPNIPAANFRIRDDLRLGEGGEVAKFNDNLRAIRTLKAIEADGRRATPEEQAILARYVGWGGLANAFPNPLTKQYKEEWRARGEELAGLLNKKEHQLASRSTLDSHYTSQAVVERMWKAAEHLGFKGGIALESSMGVGNFLGLIPQHLAPDTRFIGVEYDAITARIAALLYPQETVLNAGFQKVPLPDNVFDLAIGNPPFGPQSLSFQHKPEFNGFSIHNQFFLGAIEAVKPGGLQIQVVSRYLLDNVDASARTALAKRARLLGAIRLPDAAFKENARTVVVTDIVFLQRLTPDEEAEMEAAFEATRSKPTRGSEETERQALAAKVPAWVRTDTVPDPLGGEPMVVNSYYKSNPAMVMGTLERSGKMHGRGDDVNVRLDKGRDLGALLDAAIGRLPANVMPPVADPREEMVARHQAMSDSLRIYLSGQENGAITLDAGGNLNQVIERETPQGDYELAKRVLTPASPWSSTLYLDDKGRWYRMESVLDEKGKPAKRTVIDPTTGEPVATKQNLYERKVYANEAEIPASLLLGEAKYGRLKQLVTLRDHLVNQLNLEAEDAPAAAIEANRAKLSGAYRQFVDAHGFISESANSALVANMPDGALVQALEASYRPAISKAKADRIGEQPRAASAKPAPILSQRVVTKYEPPLTADTEADALAITLAEGGRVNMERVAQLLGKPVEQVTEAMLNADKPLVFRDPESGLIVPADEYLTGEVRRKLAAARDAGLDKNVAALEAVQPEPWGAENVTVLLGSTWVPPEVYAAFITHISGVPTRVSFSKLTNAYSVTTDGRDKAHEDQWGSEGISSSSIIEELLNSRTIRITYTDNDGNTHTDEELTKLALLKARAVRTEFSDWVFADGERRRQLVDLFNDKFNTRANRQHDGSHLILPGKVPNTVIKMRRHQNNTIWRGISERFMLIDHAVGAGKTYTAIARAMERRRMGLSKKPMIVVPNHMVEQFTKDTYRLYPGAKVLAAGKKDFERVRRRKLFAKIATGDYDLIIVPHSSFFFIGISPDTEERFLQAELDKALEAVKEAWEESEEDENSARFKPFGVKEAERLVDKLTARMDKIRGQANKDRLLTFEQMGVDDLTVDEAHEFKNLFYSSRLTNVKGMGNKTGSQKAFDLYNKVRVLRESPTGAVTFMTGTPISNSAAEMYTMMRYLAADQLRDLGLEHFDAWRAQFVSTDAAWEPNETGRLVEVNRLGRTWSNMRSLMELYYSFTDSVDNDDIKTAYAEDHNGAKFPIPEVEGGGRQSVIVQPTKAQIAVLEQTIEDFDALPGIEDPYDRNKERLRLMDRARKVSLDVRAVDPRNTSKEEGGKLDVLSRRVHDIYKKWDAELGTQLIFLDRSVPKAKGDDKVIKEYDALVAEQAKALREGDEAKLRTVGERLEKYDSNEIEELRNAQAGGWNAYQQIKDNLVALGIPANEIRFVQEANTDAAKQALFDAVKAGEVRVLIGSTQRMGAGTNVQDRLVALHHADVTWKPSDIEQREGRIIRQGNLLAFDEHGNVRRPDFKVEILAYATERTIDAKMWNLNSAKLRTINGIRKYDGAFSMDFEDEESVSMAELAALASGDPLLLERVKLMSEIDNLELLKRQHQRREWAIVGQIEDAERVIRNTPVRVAELEKEIDVLDRSGRAALAERVAQRTVEVEGKQYGSYEQAAEALKAAIDTQQKGDENAKFSVKVAGKRYQADNTALEAVRGALGDALAFEAEVDGKTFVTRTDAAREAARLATQLGADLEKGAHRTQRIGTMLGLPLELTVERGEGALSSKSVYATLALLGPDGSTFNHFSTSVDAAVPVFNTNGLRPLLVKLDEVANSHSLRQRVGYLERELEKAKAELPGWQAKKGTPFAQEDELKAKMERLEEVIRLLASGTSATRSQGPGSLQPPPEAPVRQQRRAEDRLRRASDPLPEAEEPRLSRGANGRGMQRGAVQLVAAAISSKWKEAPPVTVVQSVADLPPFPRPAPADTRGAYAQGRVWLVADNLHTPDEAQFVLAHEVLGHRGLRAVLDGQALRNELNRLRLINPELAKAARAQVAKYGYDMTLATEEALADMAGEGRTINGWQKFVALVQKALRNIGFDRAADWIEGRTAAETMSLLRRAREAIEGGKQPHLFGYAEAAAFSNGATSPWYSALARKVEALPMKAAPAAQWTGTINGLVKQGVKKDEIEWSGVNDWLALQGGKVTKAALLDYLAQNGVRVDEVTKGEDQDWAVFDPMERDEVYFPNEAEARAYAAENGIPSVEVFPKRDRGETTKYSKWVLPGGENYRELLLTLPLKEAPAPQSFNDWSEQKYGERWPWPIPAGREDEYRERQTEYWADKQNADQRRDAGNYTSSHWTELNVIAHVRFNERTDADGKRVLFIEELQSDWGQDGLKQGFKGAHAGEMPDGYTLIDDAEDARSRGYAVPEGEVGPWVYRGPSVTSRAFRERQAAVDAAWADAKHSDNRSPAAPFVTDTKAWLSLGIKRMIRYAAENGYDRIAFVNGQQSADRYDLSKQVDQIRYIKRKDGTYDVWASNQYGGSISFELDKDSLKPEQIADFVGKEVAKKIIAGEGRAEDGDMVLEGVDLKVGGEGMQQFYDKIVPQTVNEVLKKLGGGKVGQVVIERPDGPAGYRVVRADGSVFGTYSQKVDADGGRSRAGAGAKVEVNHSAEVAQPGFEITDELRAKALAGLPLFARGDFVEDRYTRGGRRKFWMPRSGHEREAEQREFDKREHYVAQIVQQLEKNGPATTAAIADRIGLDRQTTAAYLYHMNRVRGLIREKREGAIVQGFKNGRGWARKALSKPEWELGAPLRRENGKGTNLYPNEPLPQKQVVVEREYSDDELERVPDLGTTQRVVPAQQTGMTRDPLLTALFGDGGTSDVTDTPAFKRWFGNSKVVDDNGEPLVMYHGGHFKADEFSSFDRDLTDPENDLGAGFYFTSNRKDAEGYDYNREYGDDNPQVLSVYLSIKNPFIIGKTTMPSGVKEAKGEAFRAAVEAAGYDGIIDSTVTTKFADEGYSPKDGTVHVVAFHSEQIKSATGNNGQFDPANPGILFSRAGDSINATWESLRSAPTLRAVTENVKAVVENHKAFNRFNWYEKSFSTQYNKARKDADFRRVFEAAQQQVDDTARYAIESETLAPDVLVRLEGYGAIGKALKKGGKRHAADLKAVSEALFANIEGEQGVQQRRFTNQELEQDFHLTPLQIGMYHQVRAAVDTSIERLAQTALMAVAQSQGVPVAHMKDMLLEDTAALVKDALMERERDKHLRKVLQAEVDGAPRPFFEPDMTILNNVDGIVETAGFLQEAGYMPAMRFGPYALTVRDPRAEDGAHPVAFETFDSEVAAHRRALQLAKLYPGMEITRSVMNDEQYRMFKGVSPETVELFARFMGMEEDEAYQQYIALARSAKSARQRELERAGVAGFSEDLSRVLASFLLSNARQSALNVNSQNLTAALASPTLARKGDVQKEAQRLVDYVSNPNEEARKTRGAMFMYFLGGSVASAVVNLTQPVLQTLPWLTEFVGARAPALLLDASRMALTGKVSGQLLKYAFEQANADGLTQPKEIHTLMADATGSVLGSNLTLRALTNAWSGFFGQAEQFNRRVTFLAAYQAALDMGKAKLRAKGFADAYDFAKRALAETQGLYSKVNRPNFGRGPVGAVLLTFKQFSLTYLEMLMRMPAQQRLIALALLTLAAGFEGWPFMENIEDLIDTLGQSLGYNTNSKKELRQGAIGAFGDTFGEMLLHGVSRSLTGSDLGGRISLGRMVPGTQMFKLSDSRRDTNDTGGAFGSMVQAFHDAFMAAQLGNLAGPNGAVAMLMPTAVKNAIAGGRMLGTGHYHDSMGRPTTETSVYEGWLKVFGFQPATVARESEVIGDINQDRSMIGVMHAQLVGRWASAIADHDPQQVADTVARWQQWNRDNPGYRVIVTPAQLRAKVSELMIDRRIRTLKAAPLSMRAEVAAELNRK
jgi:N12 class adenine-specific DNA methylase